jgi:hypothetical protein
MKQSLLSISIFFSLVAAAQEQPSFAYAVTGRQGTDVQGWTELRQIDLKKGAAVSQVYESARSYDVYEARTGKRLVLDAGNEARRAPFSTFVAACAYDAKHNRLYYTPMGLNQLRYVDLSGKQPSFYYFESEPFGVSAGLQDAANHITRMTMGADGYGYALSNDAHHLILFSTGKKAEIVDLGSLSDDPSNGGISIHNQCSSWGGDMVADAQGHLYVLGATQSLFKVDIQNKTAKYLGHIGGLPPQFTVNGAAVNESGQLIVSSANSTLGYYQVDISAMKASPFSEGHAAYTTSDLASAYFLYDQRKAVKGPAAATLQPITAAAESKISVYPNPVTEGIFNIHFDQLQQGQYTVQIIHQSGSLVHQEILATQFKGQVSRVEVSRALTKGVYLVKVTNNATQAITTTKVVVQ